MSVNPSTFRDEYQRIPSKGGSETYPIARRKVPKYTADTQVETLMKPLNSTEQEASTDDETDEECILKEVSGGGANGIKNDNDSSGKKIFKNVGTVVLATALVSGAVIGGVAVALPAIGFGSLGVTAGSMAAAYQSSVLGGTIASGSVFATLQSVGAVGLSAAAKTAIVAGSAAVSSTATSVYTIIKDKIGKNKVKKQN